MAMQRIAALTASLLLGLALVACGPQLGDLERGEDGRVAAAFNGDGLELEGGLRVFLAEVDAPRGEAPYARQAQAELESLALHRDVRLAYGGAKRWAPTRSSDDQPAPETAIAHAFVQSEGGRWFWLQHELVSRGAAFVRPRADNHARLEDLLRLEAQARADKRGLWGERAYEILSPREAAEEALASAARCQSAEAPYRFVEGVIAEADQQQRRAVLRFSGGNAESPALAVVVFGRNFEAWRGPAFQTYVGTRVRVRGALEAFRFRDAPADAPSQPQMCIDDSGQIELIES